MLKNRLALAISILALLVSLVRQPMPWTASAQVANSSISNGSGSPTGSCTSGSVYIDSSTGYVWPCTSGAWTSTNAPGNIPSGAMVMIVSGSCPGGFTQSTALNGAMPYGTIAANGDVGGTGGSNSITPTGSNATAAFTPAGSVTAPTFTGNSGTVPAETISWPAGVPTFAGNALATHTHTLTPTGTNASVTVATTSGSKAGSSTGAFTAIAGAAAGSSFTVGAQSFTGALDTSSAVSGGTPAGTVAWPAGVPTNATTSFTPAGTNSIPTFSGQAGTVPAETWTGVQFDNRPAYVKVIFCQKS